MIHPDAFVHDKALVDQGVSIGAGTRVWGFTHLLSGAQIGADCNICEQVLQSRAMWWWVTGSR
ncbi:hypothetical protein [Synechococcus sp. SYN20]|uniref:hypothetical protein n=1 Tax=Synechococcus sp. SYN20 TaxID=1050714 RepID=UPI001CA413AD|nr:hypothetical protein [Synechococcus sp. SYN20]